MDFEPCVIAALKGRHETARPEGPGMRPLIYFFQACKDDTTPHGQTRPALDAESGSTTGRMNIAGFDAGVGRGVAAIRAKQYQSWILTRWQNVLTILSIFNRCL